MCFILSLAIEGLEENKEMATWSVLTVVHMSRDSSRKPGPHLLEYEPFDSCFLPPCSNLSFNEINADLKCELCC